MTTERVQMSDGRVVDRELKPDAKREIAVGRVTSLKPPSVQVPGFGRLRVAAVAVGLSVAVGDWVCVARVGTPSGERVVVLAALTMLGAD